MMRIDMAADHGGFELKVQPEEQGEAIHDPAQGNE
jgi:hypothetical protein